MDLASEESDDAELAPPSPSHATSILAMIQKSIEHNARSQSHSPPSTPPPSPAPSAKSVGQDSNPDQQNANHYHRMVKSAETNGLDELDELGFPKETIKKLMYAYMVLPRIQRDVLDRMSEDDMCDAFRAFTDHPVGASGSAAGREGSYIPPPL